jgi:hypothetical protein
MLTIKQRLFLEAFFAKPTRSTTPVEAKTKRKIAVLKVAMRNIRQVTFFERVNDYYHERAIACRKVDYHPKATVTSTVDGGSQP